MRTVVGWLCLGSFVALFFYGIYLNLKGDRR